MCKLRGIITWEKLKSVLMKFTISVITKFNQKLYKGVETYYRVERKKVIKNGKCIRRKWENNSRRGLQQ